MATKNPAIDAYITKSADFARPILAHLRILIHKACPDVEETMKWSMPFFDYKGVPLCNMAAFKQHCSFGFWKAALMKDKVLVENAKSESAMGHLGRIQSLKDLPPDKKITGWIKEAMALNEQSIKLKKTKPATKKPVEVPDYFLAAIRKNKKAWATFQQFPPSHVKEYIQWITEAKREETRNNRIAKAIAMMEEGKDRNWAYR
ncbi:MAG: hypothetical protein GC171_11250 [Terrimonas sp.]|nr:hypothetical protein [Terrimonas sp.]